MNKKVKGGNKRLGS